MDNLIRKKLQLYAAYFQMALAANGRKGFKFVFSDVINTEALPYGVLGVVSIDQKGAFPSRHHDGETMVHETDLIVHCRAGVASLDPMEPVELCHILLSSQGANDEFMIGIEDALKKIKPEVPEGSIVKAFPGFLKVGPITLNTSMLEDGQQALYEGRLDFSFNYGSELNISDDFPCITEEGLPDVGVNLRLK